MTGRFETLRWQGGPLGQLVLIDQTRLPADLVECTCQRVEQVWEAIRQLRVRGAPAIGIAAAYGVVLGLQELVRPTDGPPSPGAVANDVGARVDEVAAYLATSRPTAVNLFWALERMRAATRAAGPAPAPTVETVQRLLDEARRIHDEDRAMCRAIGQHGAGLLDRVHGVLTHCNAGALATSEYGTALAVLRAAHAASGGLEVYVDETRPLLQGARLTAWELLQDGIPTTLICDSMAAQVMAEGRVQAVVTGADRIAANGDTANKIGTYGLAVVARAHQVPFYVAAPTSTFDLSLADGRQIPIEQRAAEEVTCGFGTRTAPAGVAVYNPAFDVTPARLIDAIVTERGVIRPVGESAIRRLVEA